jgi:D-alanine-D-alanine ligase
LRISVDPDWWKHLFDDVYLLTDARSVCDETLTRLEVDVICELLPLEPDSRILDLCGGHGRHSLELSARGYTACTLLDYSKYLTQHARTKIAEHKYPMDVIQSDARNTGLPSESFDHVLIMGNSLGYVQEPSADRQIMAEAHRLLRPGGWFLVDVTDGEIVKKSFNPVVWHEIGDDVVVCRTRELKKNAMRVRELVLSKQDGLIRDQSYAVGLYDSNTLTALMKSAQFDRITVRIGFSPHQAKGDYGFMNHRMLATGQKNKDHLEIR